MVDIPNDVDLVDYDGDDEENPEEDPKEDLKEDPEEDPKEDPEEEPEPNNGLVNQFSPYVDPHQPGVMIGWLEENDGVNEGVNNEDIEDEDPPNTEPPNAESSDSVSSDSELEDEEADVAPEDTFGTITQRPFVNVRGLSRGGLLSSKKKLKDKEMQLVIARMDCVSAERRLHESIGWNRRFYWEMVLKGAVPKPPSDDEDDGRPRKKSKKSDRDDGPSEPRGPPISRTSLLELYNIRWIMPPKPMSEARMREIIRDQVTTSMNEFMANMNRGAGGAGAGGAGADGAGIGGAGPVEAEVTGCTYMTFMKEKDKVKFATATLQGRALTWWNGRTASMGIDAANGTPWAEVRKWMTEEFCPRSVLQRLEQELYNLKLKGTDIDGYTNRFHELALLCPRMVEPEQVKVEQYIRGLSKNIRGDVTSSQPATIDHAVRMAYQLMGQIIQDKNDEVHEGEKRKGEGDRGGRSDNRRDYNNRQNQRRANAGAMTNAVSNDHEVCPKCKNKKHNGDCWKCGKNGQDGNNRGAVYKLGAVDAQQDPKVVTGTFLLNNRYATALFDSGADKSFVSTNFSTLIDIKPVELDTSYEVELADGKV
ncbi:putative reverse transcriptase domain-containing protein, partial [Tanacetum coccineum]